MKRITKYILLTALVTLIISLCVMPFKPVPINANSIDKVKEEIQQIEQEQQEFQQEQNKLKSEKQETEKRKDSNLTKQEEITKEIEEIDRKLANTTTLIQTKENEIGLITNEINNLENEISTLEEEIKHLKSEIKQIQKRIKKREEILRNRLISLQQSGGKIKYIEVILGSQSFSDFISRSIAVTTIMAQDKTIMEDHKKDQEDLKTKKEQVETNKRELESTKKEVEEQKVELEKQKNELHSIKQQLVRQMVEKDNLMAKLEKEYEVLEEYEISLEDEQKIMAAQVSALAKAKEIAEQKKGELEQLAREKAAREEAERKQREEAEKNKNEQVGISDNSTTPEKPDSTVQDNKKYIFIQPAPLGPNKKYSHYGMRFHPIEHRWKLHGGIDIPNATGTPIKAAADGVIGTVTTGCVVGDKYCGMTYGNYITVTHFINNQSYVTLYAHLSSVNVSPGQVVSQGQVIGYMGNTGSSTGPHLHYEVHVGNYGGRINPTELTKFH